MRGGIHRIKLVTEYIKKEIEMLSEIVGKKINTVSMHRPSKLILDANIQIPNIINSYGKIFFDGFKYVSDSRMHWREDVLKIVENRQYQSLHILTHPFWYSEKNRSMEECMDQWYKRRMDETYETMNETLL